MIGYEQFSKIKDNYCICYFGHCDEYLVQLRLLKNVLEREFKELNIFFSCKDEKTSFLEGLEIVQITQIKQRKNEFAHIKEIRCNGVSHPIEDLMLESGITNFVVTEKFESPTRKCVIVTKGTMPTKSLDEMEVKTFENMAKKLGYHVSLNDKSISGAGWVIGVESPQLFEAAGKGIKTTLIDTGVGTRLYKNMFPNGNVLHN